MDQPDLIATHGGFRKLKSFQLARLIYDLTVAFTERYVDRRSRTRDQMVQAARSGVQNIAEGSQASGTSKKMELKLTNVARASLEELRLDYEDYLRQHGLPQWPPQHPALLRFKARQCSTVADVRGWVAEERRSVGVGTETRTETRTNTDEHGRVEAEPLSPLSVLVRESPCPSVSSFPPTSATLAANAALSLLNLTCYLLDRQLAAQAAAFQREGGFTERLYRVRSQARGGWSKRDRG